MAKAVKKQDFTRFRAIARIQPENAFDIMACPVQHRGQRCPVIGNARAVRH
ncbi:hypothetical protein [Novosphingobium sp.]|uniref:hypothetical protein n=1 Tax=Novosphingobium sp. TaxID=1874826 RepID=UPI0031D241C5